MDMKYISTKVIYSVNAEAPWFRDTPQNFGSIGCGLNRVSGAGEILLFLQEYWRETQASVFEHDES